ncbi:6-carboxy-5,6,7,8-tetrahydropterin synthase [Methanobrevibacter cuticularis]|uniref:6-carboxy-5,6,7,8-tetrahydropterin synthase n=1 Tax=Methanobrevibacter cuticularis TaxID=47311 RepID=A0A166FGC1_9EURY|nr:6-pyruvoyl tetrahydropterin synthase family protein [Methanobrevibacter cuticularis]KZX17644.1 6-carboxy-5,6,7,8-tetrahydropterin synthase [Methanobrevibacter cuticularis]
MKIMINGINANLRFSSAHIIPAHDSCGFIHGHSYFVDVEIEGNRSGDYDFVVDFKDVKKSVRTICKQLDHRVLIPINNNNMNFKDLGDSNNLKTLDFENRKYVEFNIENKYYKFPMEDCVLLPLKHSSAEDLSQYFAYKVFEDLIKKSYEIDSVSVCVNEGIGQGAFFKKTK